MMQNCHEITFVLERYVPNCNILTTAKNQYIDYLLFLAIIFLCRDDSIEVIDYVSDVLDLTSNEWLSVDQLYENSVLSVILYSDECLTSRLSE